jgi:hypothetical protein
MPRILLVHHPLCTIPTEVLERELAKHYQPEDFAVKDARELVKEADSNFESVAEFWEFLVRFTDRSGASLCVFSTLVADDTGKEKNLVLARITPEQILAFDLLPGGGGIVSEVGKPKEVYPIRKESSLEFVFQIIADNDKERFS